MNERKITSQYIHNKIKAKKKKQATLERDKLAF